MGNDPLAFGRIALDPDIRDATVNGVRLSLTPREFQLLYCLMERSTQVVTTDSLLEAIWGTSSVGDGHAVEVYISRLRRKLNSHLRSYDVIRTIRGRGFMFHPPPDEHQLVRFLSDAALILQEIVPDDQPLLGWQPDELIGTKFVFALQPWVHGEPGVAQRLAMHLIKVGIVDIAGPFAVPTAGGDLQLVDGSARLHSQGGKFTGMETLLRL